MLSTTLQKRIEKEIILALPKKTLDRILRRFNTLIVKHIQDFTRDGKDPNGKPFKPYSRAYRRQVSGNVDLRRTGRMMNGLKPIIGRSKFIKRKNYVEFRPVYGVVGSRNARIANYHVVQGAGRSKVKRDFLTFTDQKKIEELFQQALNEYL